MTTTASVPRRAAEAGGFLVGLSLLVVTAFWVRDGGVQHGAALGWTAVRAAGRLAGLWSADLLLVQTLLLARIPAVIRAFGADQVLHWRRWAATRSLGLLAAHLALMLAERGWPGGPGMLFATGGAAVLAVVTVAALRTVRRHALDLYACFGVTLALPHQLWAGSDFTGSAVAGAYWWGLYVLCVGGVLAYRVVRPAWRSQRALAGRLGQYR
ncbi:hypothetical protein GCM10010168_59600 [Actinoplanes ianthinogenes]|uniref:Ferric oxidoreductase domain-containing protein n=1 Tax=Actinoplanes ianthinogenes TaxID=122358 RepID=A0ABN6CML4_9ACTN|nr:hypothetical protein [Actinoplanes ianthinogenes]BCJ46321.1 hypothetical protein Aiant_69780 [Actinoplanes ianthinogenes]GGR33491.1 hypothetical protein GCM10010168_59600 [Actinoplanes ianthinogenes]